MSGKRKRLALGGVVTLSLAFLAGMYFVFAAVQGDYGVFRQVQIKAEAEALRLERDKLSAELAEMQNLTLRLSDGYLDIDLLDQQARDVLGYVRSDEIVIQ
ncbi:FtsB family cell division protein [Neogemmobacter tilapiae]|uniref:Septum formation initiator n=1 Tax=Neogemmobacter tilapiae TaxID=875041 RepID=A0A918TFE7_9RHOB|nr:septum formation initiator family protein [Gemmobacter tilapiae]GHC46191.1 septum formation initiator precursor [Gemmobacter tilapiae]